MMERKKREAKGKVEKRNKNRGWKGTGKGEEEEAVYFSFFILIVSCVGYEIKNNINNNNQVTNSRMGKKKENIEGEVIIINEMEIKPSLSFFLRSFLLSLLFSSS